jgi:hypothetical protein
MHSFMLVRHGHVVAEGWWRPQTPDTRHQMYSLSKSFTSTAVGLAVSEGKLSIDDPVLKFFPDDAPPGAGPNLRRMRVRDLLAMSTGHREEPRFGDDQPWAKTFLEKPVAFKPGTHFLYNSAGPVALPPCPSPWKALFARRGYIIHLDKELSAPHGYMNATAKDVSTPRGEMLGDRNDVSAACEEMLPALNDVSTPREDMDPRCKGRLLAAQAALTMRKIDRELTCYRGEAHEARRSSDHHGSVAADELRRLRRGSRTSRR